MFGSDMYKIKLFSLYLVWLWWTRHNNYKKSILPLICIVVKLTYFKK
jgi:hypothetical protein